MMKRILSILLCCVLLLELLPAKVFADGSTSLTGTGTEDDPYQISTADDLKAFRDMVNGGNSDVNAILMNDIVLNDGTFDKDGNYTKGESGNDAEAWVPIGRYYGKFDGQGHTVKGLFVTGQKSAGLFGILVNATVKNVIVTGYVSGTQSVGGIAGAVFGGNMTYIENCVNKCYVVAYEDDILGIAAGGILGTDTNQTLTLINNCANLGTVTSSGDSETLVCGAGGIVGATSLGTSVENCYNVGKVTADSAGENIVGGIAMIDGNRTVSNCYFLKGTAEKMADNLTDDPSNNVFVITKAELANGDLLELLRNNNPDSPWEKCGYIDNVGMTLPLLKGQSADSHDHRYHALGICDCGTMTHKGTKDDPFEIKTAEELKLFRDIVNGENGQEQSTSVCAKLMNDIVLNDGTFDEDGNYTKGESGNDAEAWIPIGNSSDPFYNGTFDGNGKTVKGLYVNEDTGVHYAGLFGYVDGATIKNVTVNGYIDVNNAGGIVGTAVNSRISGCTNAAILNWCDRSGDSYFVCFGGIIGIVMDTVITQCRNIGTLCVSSNGYVQIGGIAGCVYSSETTRISNCYNAGTLKCTGISPDEGSVYMGGIVGDNEDVNIKSCYNVGTLNTSCYNDIRIGGIAGNSDSTVNNCYYLKGTAKDSASAKTKTEFANGEVLKMLQNGDENSPWADECEYLIEAGMTVPVFEGQGDEHICNYKLKYNSDEHWQECECGMIKADSKAAHTCTGDGDYSGKKATCKEKAICKICGESYGELDAANHSDLKHIDAKAATRDAEGNIEYWYCSDCNKYYKDIAATQEIAKADTVTAKLHDENKSPQMGDNSDFALWIALLFISSCAVTSGMIFTVMKAKKRVL